MSTPAENIRNRAGTLSQKESKDGRWQTISEREGRCAIKEAQQARSVSKSNKLTVNGAKSSKDLLSNANRCGLPSPNLQKNCVFTTCIVHINKTTAIFVSYF